jgi:hypothetical protein
MTQTARPPRPSLSILVRLLVVGVVAIVSAFGPVGEAHGASPVFRVDGKHGSDTNPGTESAPFKSIKAGLWALRYGGRLEVVGYDDHVYYEQMTASQWLINGTATSPIIVQAAGYGTTGYIRPLVSGALVVNRPGQARWTRPDAARYPSVWATPWTTPISGYEAKVNGFMQERIFVDTSQPLRRPAPVPTLAQLESAPGSQYWNGKTLYVRLGGWGAPAGASTSLDPNQHTVEIPHYTGLLVGTGSSYVTVQGFRVRHTLMGVGFTGNAHHNLAQDIDASYNNPMGFWTGSDYNTFRRITGTRNTIQLVKLDNGADHNLVEGAVGIENLGQGIKLTGRDCAYNTVRGSTFSGGNSIPMSAGGYGGYVQGIDIEEGAHDNLVQSNRIERNRRGLMLYQVTSGGGPLNGNVIKYNTFVGNDTAVTIWDGKFSSTNGGGSVSFFRNTYDGNRIAVATEATTSRKTFNQETFFRTGSTKALSNSAFYLKAGSVKLVNSILRSTAGYAFYAKAGAKLSVSYTTVYSSGLGVRNSSATTVLGTGYRAVDPKFLSMTSSSPDFLYIGPSSPVFTKGSSGGPLGARWR